MIIIMVISSHLIAWLLPSLRNNGTAVTALFTIVIIIFINITIIIITIIIIISSLSSSTSSSCMKSNGDYQCFQHIHDWIYHPIFLIQYVIYDFCWLSFFTSILLFCISCRLAGQIHSLNSHYLMDLPPPLSCPSII